MSLTLVPEQVEQYAVAHSTAMDPLYERLKEATLANTDLPQMQVGPLEGRLLTLLAQLTGATLAVEVGTFTGYSALCIAAGLAEGGRLITCDKNELTTGIARQFWAEAPQGDRIELRLGDAVETVKAIEGPIDLVFIDADKANYVTYWETLLPKVRPGGLLIVDNVLWSGTVLEPETDSAKAIDAFNRHVAADPRVEHVMLTVRDGITVARKR